MSLMNGPRQSDGVAAAVIIAAAVAVAVIGVRYGTFTASDTDPYGYVSLADLMAGGALRVNQQFVRSMPWPNAEWSFAPYGYIPAPERGFISPVYPVGVPMIMAAFQRIVGDRTAVFYVVPLFGAVAVWMTGWLGIQLHSRLAGAMAATLLATSPAFLYQVIQPTSDVAAVAWWATSLALIIRATPSSTFGSGVAASLAIMTRPNLVPLAAVVGAFVLRNVVSGDRQTWRADMKPLLLFAAGVIPGCLIVAGVNAHLHGSPLRTGYGPLAELYTWANVRPNLDRYSRWLLETQTPFILLALLAPWFRQHVRHAHAWLLLAFAAVVCALYMPYLVFAWDDWVYLRFLLPAFPALLVLSVIVGLDLLHRVPLRVINVAVPATILASMLVVWQFQEASRRGAFTLRLLEKRYENVGRYIAGALPREAVFISGLHAGSIRYYADRVTLVFGRMHARSFDEALEALRARGYRPYLTLERGEEDAFRMQFAAHSDLAALDWPPIARTFRGVEVRIYDPADRARYLAGEPIATGDIELIDPPVITQR